MSEQKNKDSKGIGFFQKYLTIWVEISYYMGSIMYCSRDSYRTIYLTCGIRRNLRHFLHLYNKIKSL